MWTKVYPGKRGLIWATKTMALGFAMMLVIGAISIANANNNQCGVSI